MGLLERMCGVFPMLVIHLQQGVDVEAERQFIYQDQSNEVYWEDGQNKDHSLVVLHRTCAAHLRAYYAVQVQEHPERALV